jgi:hypothetical protein
MPDQPVLPEPPDPTPQESIPSKPSHLEGEVDRETPVGHRRYPSTIGGMIYLSMLAVVLVGIALSATGAWRSSMVWMGGSLLVSAVARLLLPENQVGMLKIRGRIVDVVVLVFLGSAVITAALAIPMPQLLR